MKVLESGHGTPEAAQALAGTQGAVIGSSAEGAGGDFAAALARLVGLVRAVDGRGPRAGDGEGATDDAGPDGDGARADGTGEASVAAGVDPGRAVAAAPPPASVDPVGALGGAVPADLRRAGSEGGGAAHPDAEADLAVDAPGPRGTRDSSAGSLHTAPVPDQETPVVPAGPGAGTGVARGAVRGSVGARATATDAATADEAAGALGPTGDAPSGGPAGNAGVAPAVVGSTSLEAPPAAPPVAALGGEGAAARRYGPAAAAARRAPESPTAWVAAGDHPPSAGTAAGRAGLDGAGTGDRVATESGVAAEGSAPTRDGVLDGGAGPRSSTERRAGLDAGRAAGPAPAATPARPDGGEPSGRRVAGPEAHPGRDGQPRQDAPAVAASGEGAAGHGAPSGAAGRSAPAAAPTAPPGDDPAQPPSLRVEGPPDGHRESARASSASSAGADAGTSGDGDARRGAGEAAPDGGDAPEGAKAPAAVGDVPSPEAAPGLRASAARADAPRAPATPQPPAPPTPTGQPTVRLNPAGDAATVKISHPELGPLELELALQGRQLVLTAVTASTSAARALRAAEAVLRAGAAAGGFELRSLRLQSKREPRRTPPRPNPGGGHRPLDLEA